MSDHLRLIPVIDYSLSVSYLVRASSTLFYSRSRLVFLPDIKNSLERKENNKKWLRVLGGFFPLSPVVFIISRRFLHISRANRNVWDFVTTVPYNYVDIMIIVFQKRSSSVFEKYPSQIRVIWQIKKCRRVWRTLCLSSAGCQSPVPVLQFIHRNPSNAARPRYGKTRTIVIS